VADAWQGSGLGSIMAEQLFAMFVKGRYRFCVLWGGVQQTNIRAVNFYLKLGFTEYGRFEYNGLNIDMVLDFKV